jgi:hypothetical protein
MASTTTTIETNSHTIPFELVAGFVAGGAGVPAVSAGVLVVPAGGLTAAAGVPAVAAGSVTFSAGGAAATGVAAVFRGRADSGAG